MEFDSKLQAKFTIYYITALFSLVFAVAGFSYNAWRMEASEDNSNIRTAAFEVFTELAELQQIIYAGHYDQDTVKGNPRDGWVRVELISELSGLIGPQVHREAESLKKVWGDNWEKMAHDRDATDLLIEHIDRVRAAIKDVLKSLK